MYSLLLIAYRPSDALKERILFESILLKGYLRSYYLSKDLYLTNKIATVEYKIKEQR